MTENEKLNEALEDFEMFCKGKILCVTGEALEMIRTAIKEREQYRAIGTIEEFKVLKEKSVVRKIRGTRFEEAICPRCESELFDTYWVFGGIHYCSNCGQTIDWQ